MLLNKCGVLDDISKMTTERDSFLTVFNKPAKTHTDHSHTNFYKDIARCAASIYSRGITSFKSIMETNPMQKCKYYNMQLSWGSRGYGQSKCHFCTATVLHLGSTKAYGEKARGSCGLALPLNTHTNSTNTPDVSQYMSSSSRAAL